MSVEFDYLAVISLVEANNHVKLDISSIVLAEFEEDLEKLLANIVISLDVEGFIIKASCKRVSQAFMNEKLLHLSMTDGADCFDIVDWYRW